MDNKERIITLLMQYQHDTNQIMQRYMPDKLGSDAYRAEMMALTDSYSNAILDIFS
jgi:hypothetical protein